MSEKDRLQEELAEALEHTDQHPVTPEEYEIPEDILLKMYEKMRKSASITQMWIEEQNKIWGTNEKI